MPIGGKDAFLSKVTFRRESNWYSKTKQELKDMEKIEERAELNLQYERNFCGYNLSDNMVKRAYVKGATEQKAIDFAMFQSFLSERGLLFDKYTKANGDTGYKTLDDLRAYFNNKE